MEVKGLENVGVDAKEDLHKDGVEEVELKEVASKRALPLAMSLS